MNNELLRTINELSRRLERLETLEAQRRHIAIRLRRTTDFLHPGGSTLLLSVNNVDATSHPSLSLSDGTGFVAPRSGLYLISASVRFGRPIPEDIVSGDFAAQVRVNDTTTVLAATAIVTIPTFHPVGVVNLNANDTVRLYVYSSIAIGLPALTYAPLLCAISL